ncbi:hypothetical protein NIES4102_44150 (plasmid) [Chondrocystis sp. NIES-4102]|nr:hypothetical protein NIES4102_44150 [Chondrocystis sp. NIES-4102]
MNNQSKNPWNPFVPTEKDLVRTEELANKNAVMAGVLSFVFFPVGLIYLNRAINSLKILGYTVAISLILGLSTNTEENSNDLSNLVSCLGLGALTTEQVMTVNKARARRQGKSTSTVDQFNMNDKYAKLKELKLKHENNEISTEEFQIEKQKLLDSV